MGLLNYLPHFEIKLPLVEDGGSRFAVVIGKAVEVLLDEVTMLYDDHGYWRLPAAALDQSAMKDFIVGFGWFVLMGKNGIRPATWRDYGVGGEVVGVGRLYTVLMGDRQLDRRGPSQFHFIRRVECGGLKAERDSPVKIRELQHFLD